MTSDSVGKTKSSHSRNGVPERSRFYQERESKRLMKSLKKISVLWLVFTQ
jgi:hypothetical protein